MGVVLDAVVVRCSIWEGAGLPHSLTASPGELLDLLKSDRTPIFIDEGGIMMHEWSEKVDPDLFANWMFAFSAEANLIAIEPEPCRDFLEKLRVDCSFPRSRDRTVVSVAITVAGRLGEALLTTEDADYYDPAGKRDSATRTKLVEGRSVGAVSKLLKKSRKVHVLSVARSLDYLQA